MWKFLGSIPSSEKIKEEDMNELVFYSESLLGYWWCVCRNLENVPNFFLNQLVYLCEVVSMRHTWLRVSKINYSSKDETCYLYFTLVMFWPAELTANRVKVRLLPFCLMLNKYLSTSLHMPGTLQKVAFWEGTATFVVQKWVVIWIVHSLLTNELLPEMSIVPAIKSTLEWIN